MGEAVDVEADKEVAPSAVASFCVDFGKFEGCVG